MRAVAICDARNGKTDAEQFSARMELLTENLDLESRPKNQLTELMKQFFELSNETDDSDHEWPFQQSDDRVCIRKVIEQEQKWFSWTRILENIVIVTFMVQLAIYLFGGETQ